MSYKSRAARYACVGLTSLTALAVGVTALLALDPMVGAMPASPKSPTRPMASATAVPGNLDKLRRAISSGSPITVFGLGSSVGVGLTLPDPSTQAPPGYLAQKLGRLSPGGATATNLSVDGSVASEGINIYRRYVKQNHPTVLILAYGMNDGRPDAYNSGQTFPGAIKALREIATEAIEDGTTVLIATTPSPHMGRADFRLPSDVPLTYPKARGALTPPSPAVNVNGVTFSSRHDHYNKEVKKLALALKVDVLDVVPSWTAAVAMEGEDKLFDPRETVHPNLAGHAASYWAAIDSFAATLKPEPASR